MPSAPLRDWARRVHARIFGERDLLDPRAPPGAVRVVEGEPGVEAEDVGLALPRLLLAPVRLVTNTAFLWMVFAARLRQQFGRPHAA